VRTEKQTNNEIHPARLGRNANGWTDAATNSPLSFYRVKLGLPLP
jgi:hypothetical protein